MNVHHQIYAATRTRGGFDVFYQSPNLSKFGVGVAETLKRNAVYRGPFLLDANTDIKLYPENYMYYRIEEGQFVGSVVAHTNYTGTTNHTPDRRGNFITHSVLLDDSLDNCHIPLLMDEISFYRHLTIDEESNFQAPKETIEYPKENLSSLIEKNVRFLNTKECYLNAFLEVIDHIQDGWLEDKGKNITVFAPTNQDCIKLIFAVYSLLPSYVINQYSFATYVASPSSVSFKICGIIPKCGVTNLNSTYFKLIKVDDSKSRYTPSHTFTKVLKNWISNECIDSLMVLEDKFRDFDIARIDKSAEVPFEIEMFKEEIAEKSVSDLNKILQSFLPDQKDHKDKLLDYLSKENPRLFFEYKLQEAKSDISKNISISNHLNVIDRCLRDLHTSYSDNDLLVFYQGLETVLYNRTLICTQLLVDDYNGLRSILKGNPLLCDYLLAHTNKKWNDIKNEDKEVIANEYRELVLEKKYPNIQSWLSFKDLMNDIQNGTFSNKRTDYETYLLKLSVEKRKALVRELIDVMNGEGLLNADAIKEIVILVNNYLPEPEGFWNNLFKGKKDSEKDEYWMDYTNTWPVTLIKRHFVYNFVDLYEDLHEFHDIIGTLDEYETRWVLEKLVETHKKDGHDRLLKATKQRKSRRRWL